MKIVINLLFITVADLLVTCGSDNHGSSSSDTASLYKIWRSVEGGIIAGIYSETYDTNGLRIEDTADRNADGIIDARNRYVYDTVNNSFTILYDNNDDGIIDIIRTHTYDTAGNRISTSNDENGDGVTDSTSSFRCDSNGNNASNVINQPSAGAPAAIVALPINNLPVISSYIANLDTRLLTSPSLDGFIIALIGSGEIVICTKAAYGEIFLWRGCEHFYSGMTGWIEARHLSHLGA